MQRVGIIVILMGQTIMLPPASAFLYDPILADSISSSGGLEAAHHEPIMYMVLLETIILMTSAVVGGNQHVVHHHPLPQNVILTWHPNTSHGQDGLLT